MEQIYSLRLEKARVEQKNSRMKGLVLNAKAVRYKLNIYIKSQKFTVVSTLAERCLLSLQPYLHNIQWSDCKQNPTSNHKTEAAKYVQMTEEKKKHTKTIVIKKNSTALFLVSII